MLVNEIMSPIIVLASTEATLEEVARSMALIDVGALPIGEYDQLVGMITDRDIVVRAISRGLDPARTRVRDIMTPEINYCFDDDDVQEVSRKLAGLRVRRLPVLDVHKRLVGMISLGDLSQSTALHESGAALRDISRSGT